MDIFQRIEKGGVWLLELSGRIDTETAPVLNDAVAQIPEGTTQVVLDFTDVPYISSAGLRGLLMCRKRFPGKDAMLARNISDAVYEIFTATGFDSLIPYTLAQSEERTLLQSSLKEFVEQKVKQEADRVAIVDNGISFTWAEIGRGSDILADDLEKLGVKKGAHVVLCGKNSANWIMTFYAIQKLGAIALLINPSQVAKEIGSTAKIGEATYFCYGEMVEMKNEEEFLAELSQNANCPRENFYSICASNDLKARIQSVNIVKDRSRFQVEPDDTAAMIFTSGSTGKPKGVLLSSYNLLASAYSGYKDQTLTAEDKSCLILPLFHIFGATYVMLANAIAGSTIYIPADIRTSTILNVIDTEKCTFFYSVPTMLIALLNNKDFSPEKVASVRGTTLAGAATTAAQMKLFREKMPNNHFFVAYGLSEMARVSMTVYGDTDEHLYHTVGLPVNGIQIKVVNMTTGKECAQGEVGEVCVQDSQLMTGYYKVPIEDQPIDQNGWLHTGDLGFFNPDGYLTLSGRIKELIIRGGENIMPGQVESAISALECIDNVRVVGVPSDFFGEEVCACITLKPGFTFDEEDMRLKLKDSLAKFKIPAYFVVYEKFPLLGSGKIDTVSLKKDVLAKLKA